MQIEVIPMSRILKNEEEIRKFPKIIEAFYGEPMGDETKEECQEMVRRQKEAFFSACRKEGIDFPEWHE